MNTYKIHAHADKKFGKTKCGMRVRQVTKHGDRYLPMAKACQQPNLPKLHHRNIHADGDPQITPPSPPLIRQHVASKFASTDFTNDKS